MKKILAISGSLRSNSSNEKLLRAAISLAPPALQIEFAGIDQLPFFNPDQDSQNTPKLAQEFRDLVAGSDGLLISSPEYAHGVPGVLKNALDWLVGDPRFEGKSIVLICGGQFAPVQLEETLKTMSADLLRNFLIPGPQLRKAFDENGNLVDENLREEIRTSLLLFP
jgi:NAD(P)H-dependent FMN reductase